MHDGLRRRAARPGFVRDRRANDRVRTGTTRAAARSPWHPRGYRDAASEALLTFEIQKRIQET